MLRKSQRLLSKLSHHYFHSLFKLRIFPLPHLLRIELYFNIRRDAAILHVKLSIGVPDSEAWRGHRATVHQVGCARNSDKSTPSTFANERPCTGATEVPRHSVAPGTRVFIDDHHLGPEDGAVRLEQIVPFAWSHDAKQLAVEDFNNVGRERAATIEALIDDDALLPGAKK
jgi:hypothetical protein